MLNEVKHLANQNQPRIREAEILVEPVLSEVEGLGFTFAAHRMAEKLGAGA